MDDPVLDRYVLNLVDRPRPRICFLPTAASNVAAHIVAFLDAFPARRFEPVALDLYERPANLDLERFFVNQDVVYVGAGNTANLLAVWRTHGADRALQAAWEAGVVVCGVSAGAGCWFEGSANDSFGIGTIAPLADGLGLLPGSFCPHYDRQPSRRAAYERMLADGDLPPGIACDDNAAVHFVGSEVVEVVATRKGAGAYRVAPAAEGAHHDPIPARSLI